MGSSAERGGYANIGSSTAGNLQFLNQMDQFQKQMSHYGIKASQYAGQAEMFSSLGNLAATAGQTSFSSQGPTHITPTSESFLPSNF